MWRARQFFLSGKTLPIERGRGLQQPAMQTAVRLLGRGDWVHVFPEGRVGYSGRVQPCKWGVGKLVCDCVAESGRLVTFPVLPSARYTAATRACASELCLTHASRGHPVTQ